MAFTDPLDALEAVIRSRRGTDPGASYTASLFAKGRPKIAQKLGEEAVEAVIAAVRGDRAELIGEAADVLFHLLVVLVDAGLTLDDVRAELSKREGVSGLVEKAARPKAAAVAVAEPVEVPVAVPVAEPVAESPVAEPVPASSPLPLSGGSATGAKHDSNKASDREQALPRPLPQAGGGF